MYMNTSLNVRFPIIYPIDGRHLTVSQTSTLGPCASTDTYLGSKNAACQAKRMAAYGSAGKDSAAAEGSEATFYGKYRYPWILYDEAEGRGAMPSHQPTTTFMLPPQAKTVCSRGYGTGYSR